MTGSLAPPPNPKRRRLAYKHDSPFAIRPSSMLHLRYAPAPAAVQSYASKDEQPPFSLELERHKASLRLRSAWDDICRRYGRDFGDETDVVDIITGEIVEDHGHLSGLAVGGSTGDIWRPKRRYRRKQAVEYDDGHGSGSDGADSDDDHPAYATDASDELLSAPATSVVYSSSPRKHSPRRPPALGSSPPPPHACPSRLSYSEYEDSEYARSKKIHELDLLIQSWSTQVLTATDVPVPIVANAGPSDEWTGPAEPDIQDCDLGSPRIQSPEPLPAPKMQQDDDEVAPAGQDELVCGMKGYHCGRNFCFTCM
ncbi:hypothetical protein POJ06DRAFT_252284 [Lipomyces tetrasporus]|uniref:Uncharacterized protein n=1 Tax=Lipomyces tetrasporus TaxID=54092 RepID=A0AAD7QRP4_9ASCO|nr:uncharacterized protein POJ06DRAFT_252284 [Lipomyces tetrasporus]KAJ8100294.1 hypothetical protein POJ06DRAFT_252284 [Lipomyces tetrasporus]